MSRPKLLFLSRWYPWPVDNGSRLRVYNILKGLAVDFDITLLSFCDDNAPEETPEALLAICKRVETVRWRDYQPSGLRARLALLHPTPRSMVDTHSAEMAARIDAVIDQHDVAIASQFNFLPYADAIGRIPALLEELEIGNWHDQRVEADSARAKLRNTLTWGKAASYLRRQVKQFATVTVVSERERQLVADLVSAETPVLVIRNGIDLDSYADVVPQSQPNTLIYTGALTYQANYAAVDYFLRDIWPTVSAELPTTQFKITGRAKGVAWPPVPIDERVQLTGFLPDVRPVLAGATISVVPLLQGGGTRLKILEAMALKVPVVATAKGAEGLHAVNGQHLLIAHNSAEFAQQTLQLLQDAALRERLAHNAYEFVNNTYRWDAILPELTRATHHLVRQFGSEEAFATAEKKP